MALAAPYIPTYHDTNVTFTGPTSAGNAAVHWITGGDSTLPTILLLHGFPTSGYQYRDFIPLLADSYHVIAPDLPGFGLTTVDDDFSYTFDNLAAVIAAWLQTIAIDSFALYIFDYGAPVGLRIATEHPDWVKTLISQNGNAYVEGFGQEFWQPVFNLWNSSNAAADRQVVRENLLTLAGTEYQYTAGFPESDLHLRNPSSWHFDYFQNIAGPKQTEIQLDLFYDYRTNVEAYPTFHRYFRDSNVPTLAVWGRGDPAFISPGAEAFRKDSPSATVRFVDAGHFALETKRWEIAELVRGWLTGIGY